MIPTSEAASQLHRALGCPIYNGTLRKETGDGKLDYEVHLRTRELLAPQAPAAELVVPDELLFQILHQTQELSLKFAAFETATRVEHLDREDLFGTLSALYRILLIPRALGEEIRIMFTLSPSSFHVIRRSLGNGSGLESPGYDQILAAAEASMRTVERLLDRHETSLLAIYGTPEMSPELYRVLERFVDWDTAFQSWLVEHFMLVRRTLGIDKAVPALDGFPAMALGARMTRPLFPALWSVRVQMSRAWARDGGYAPGKERV